jgi:hypothetical protein
MKKKTPLIFLSAFVLLVFCGAYYERSDWNAVNLRGYNLTAEGPATFSGATTMSGTTTLSGATTISGSATLTDTLITPFDAVALTTPTTSFAAANKHFITLTADVNMTGVTITGGTVGQTITIVTGAGSNTIRFDDNASTLSLGANITVTEGQQDSLSLVCTGDRTWAATAAHDN